jgi:hypothetical protein
MHMSDMVYMWHQMRDVAISMWESSPIMIIAIAVALSGATYFVYKR